MTESKMQLEDWLDDLCVRFIINLPEEDLSSVQRICFHVEEAQWFYEDFIRPLDPSLPAMTLRTFCLKIFAHCPLLSVFSHQSTIQAFQMFMDYKQGVPVRGAILLNEAMDHILLVKGWKKSANWSFPRGKTNKDEGDLDCAIREVWEEIGYDIRASGLIGESEVPFIDLKFQDKEMKMFIFTGVPMDTHFETQTRQEISKIAWWPLADLPGYRKNRPHQAQADTVNPNKFFMVEQFIRRLKKWIATEQKKKNSRRSTSNQYLSTGLATEDLLTEEDQATDGNVQEPDYPPEPVSGIGTLEGATAELNRLLGRVPPTQGLHVEALSEIQSAASKPAGKGNELLAFLHGTTPQVPFNAPPQTPADLVYTNVPDPKTPHHSHQRPPHFSSMAPPPTFPFHPNSASGANFQTQGSTHYPGHQFHSQYDGLRQPGYQQGPGRPQHVSRPQQFQQSYQTPLVHPQPLPPHVQKAVFTGAPVHSPALPQQRQPQQGPSLNQDAEASSMQNPRFPGLHAPMVAPSNNQSPKLTSHSLALLNVFNGRDDRASDLPLRKFTQDTVQAPQPQELHAEPSQPRNELLTNQNGARQNIPSNMNLNQTFSRPPISGEHKSTLLEIFKSPTTTSAVPPTAESKKLPWDMVSSSGVASIAAPSTETEKHMSVLLGMFKTPKSPAAAPDLPQPMEATSLPTTSVPSAVELSAVEPLSEATLASSSNNGKRAVHNDFGEGLPQTNPEVMLPFRATSILARPQQPQATQLAEQTEHTRNAPERRAQASARKAAGNSTKTPPAARKKSPQKNVEKPFQPQILKRPQQQSPVVAAAELPVATPPGPTALPVLPAQSSSAANQKQELLSMFRTPSATSPAASHARTDVPLVKQASQPGKNEHDLLSLLGQVPATGPSLLRTQSKFGTTPASYVPAGSSHSNSIIQPEDRQQHLLSLFGKAPESGASLSRTQSHEGQSASAYSSATPNRQTIQPGEQQQKLLSMLGKVPPAPGASLITAQPKDGTSTAPLAETAMGPSSRSRVGSLASGVDQTRRGSVAPDLPEDKSAFLLDLLTKLN